MNELASLISVSALLLVLRHFYYVGRHVSDQCYNTYVMWATTSLINASALLLVLRHFCYVGKQVSDQSFGSPASATELLFHGQARLYSVLYCTFGHHSLLPVYAGKYLYVVYMNNMIHEIKSTQFCSVIYTNKHLHDKNMNNE